MKKATWHDLAMMIAALLAATGCAVVGWVNQTWAMAVSGTLLALVFGYSLIDTWKAGLRPSTTFEQFEWRIFVRAILFLVGGGIGLFALSQTAYFVQPNLLIGLFIVVWLAVSLYFFSRVRGRWEAVAAYKRRIGYQDDNQNPG